jgi:cytochrome c-type biogenesis protein CcmH/NrfG
VIVFGVHSLVDWTWYVPGNACVALLCAGWLAGRGPLGAPRQAPGAPLASTVPREREGAEGWRGRSAVWARGVGPVRGGLAAAAILAALLAAWSQWQPQRSEDARQEALELLASNPAGATAAAERAVSRDPLSAEALFTLADVESVDGHAAQARATLEKAVRMQPSNPKTWLELGRFELAAGRPVAALPALRATIYLNPESIAPENIAPPNGQREGIEIYNDYIQALRATQAKAPLKSARGRRAGAAAGARQGARRRPARRRSGSRTPRSAG